MIRHLVLLKWNEGVDAAHVAAVKAGLDRLPALIPEIVSFQHGADLQLKPGTADYAISVDFASTNDYFTYRENPDHQRFIKECLTDYCQRLVAQFSLD